MYVQVRERIADGIERDLSVRSRLSAYEIQGRVKSVLSAFKKVFRQVAPLPPPNTVPPSPVLDASLCPLSPFCVV